MKDGITNLSASVHARLLNKAKAEKRPFEEMLGRLLVAATASCENNTRWGG